MSGQVRGEPDFEPRPSSSDYFVIMLPSVAMHEHLISPQELAREARAEPRAARDNSAVAGQEPAEEPPDLSEDIVALRAATQALILERQRYEDKTCHAVADLALEIAGAFLRDSAVDKELALITARAELRRLAPSAAIQIRVSPPDYKNVASALQEDQVDIHVISDSSLRPGDCLVESPTRIVDGRLDSRLKRVQSALRADEETHPW
jgi:flagellar biosynthesis/type III secretory pathway protein FliH